jgi:hypothetical protein
LCELRSGIYDGIEKTAIFQEEAISGCSANSIYTLVV